MTADKRARMSDEEIARIIADERRDQTAGGEVCIALEQLMAERDAELAARVSAQQAEADAVVRLTSALRERDEARELLGKMLCIIDHGRAYSCGRCGEPGAICDDDCATATYQAQDIHRARTLAK